ncbi:hypothetical protein [Glaciecola sp. KUL10]|uniref:hypothetical protein n=1 Tax=Glaciecola sp. (strain KUL10) TaxID=2161813 RepID=UPI000D788277|nr:hypothetical protein [Glaciecola sp. KUL10]GBL05963.1 hypothetical protein KUL10_32960 [Glaciecola sp. KUL10]
MVSNTSLLNLFFLLLIAPFIIISCDATATTKVTNQANNVNLGTYFNKVMNATPIMPAKANYSHVMTSVCLSPQNANSPANKFKTNKQSQTELINWESRVAHDWTFFNISADDGKILVIDFKQLDQNVGFRYLANAHTQTELYEPWSSSKIQAYSAAMAKIRAQNKTLGANAFIGDIAIADMISSINSYEQTGLSPDDSNALASLFANIAGRDYLTDLFYQEWLNLSQQGAFFRGAYGPFALEVDDEIVSLGTTALSLETRYYETAIDDPGYLAYRCSDCGLTGNKPMYTLAQAEWLKRLATHQSHKETRHPYLEQQDVDVLFYGNAVLSASSPIGGMKNGISNMLQIAIAQAISAKNINNDLELAKKILDRHTQGEWRVFQKIGWGISETRSATENVVLAHVCLPNYQGGRAFTVVAQAAIGLGSDIELMNQEQEYAELGRVGQKMQTNLTVAMKKLLQ